MLVWLPLVFGAYALLVWVGQAAQRGPRNDLATGLVWIAVKAYLRLVHRARFEGLENVPRGRDPGPLIITANHTAGIDPMLVQAAVPFYVRWMMARRMMIPSLYWLWDWLEIVPVAGGGKELASARQAMRTVQGGAVLGIFPEGGIERPARHLLPFVPGVGLIIAKTGAPVLPLVIDGTPASDTAWGSLTRFSRSRVRVMPMINYSKSGLKPDQIAADLQRRYQEWTGWPVNEAGGPGQASVARPARAESRVDSPDGLAAS